MIMISEHTLTWAGQEVRECEPQLLRFHTFRIKVESSDINRFLPNYSHTSTQIYSTIICIINCFITIHFRNQKKHQFKTHIITLFTILHSTDNSKVTLLITWRYYLLLTSTLSITSPLYNYGSNFSHFVVILNRTTLDSQVFQFGQ